MALPVISPEITTFRGLQRVESHFPLNANPNPNSNFKLLGKALTFKRNVNSGSSKFRVCALIKDLDVGVCSESDNVNARLHGQFSAPVKQKTDKEEEEEKRNFYLNLGYAIRSLREEFPQLFYKEPSFDIYRGDIVFKDPLNTFVGIENYKSIFWGLRFHGRMFFRALWIDVISVWQPVENVIMVRWTVHGIPRIPWEGHGRFDGTSEYKFDKNGKIFEHRVDNIALNSPPKFNVLTVAELIQSLGCPSTPKATYFKSSSSSSSGRK